MLLPWHQPGNLHGEQETVTSSGASSLYLTAQKQVVTCSQCLCCICGRPVLFQSYLNRRQFNLSSMPKQELFDTGGAGGGCISNCKLPKEELLILLQTVTAPHCAGTEAMRVHRQ